MLKKRILFVILVLLIILSGVVLYLGVIYKSNNVVSKERLRELYDNSYKYYLLTEGDLTEIGDSDGISIDGVNYSSIKGYSSISDLDSIIDSTFLERYREMYRESLFGSREFIGVNNKVYYATSNYSFCDTSIVPFEDIKVSKSDAGKWLITTDSVITSLYYENGDWYLAKPLFFCNADIGEE